MYVTLRAHSHLAWPHSECLMPPGSQYWVGVSLDWGSVFGKKHPTGDVYLHPEAHAPRLLGDIGSQCLPQSESDDWLKVVEWRWWNFKILSSFIRWGASLVAQTVKDLPAIQETWVQSLAWDDPLEKGKATHSSILAWRIPWIEEPGRLQPMRLQRVRHDWSYLAHVYIYFSFGSLFLFYSILFLF